MDLVDELIKEWSADPNRYVIREERRQDGGVEIVGRLLKPVPNDLGLVVGDALYALRSALDNLAFSLACRNNPGMTADEQQDVAFPIGNVPPALGDKRIKNMSQIAQGHVIGLCPDPAVGPLNEHPLWLLNKANNRDKHRVVTVAVAAVTNYSMNFSGVLTGGGSVGPGAPQVTAQPGDKVVFASGGPGSQIQTKMSASLQIVFGQNTEVENRPVGDTLRWFHDHIRDAVFQTLEQDL